MFSLARLSSRVRQQYRGRCPSSAGDLHFKKVGEEDLTQQGRGQRQGQRQEQGQGQGMELEMEGVCAACPVAMGLTKSKPSFGRE
jgi:hypothetical protein